MSDETASHRKRENLAQHGWCPTAAKISLTSDGAQTKMPSQSVGGTRLINQHENLDNFHVS